MCYVNIFHVMPHVSALVGCDNQGPLRARFPWCKDVSVDRRFWETLVCLDPRKKGWIMDEHVELWENYMWHVRPQDADWAMVGGYFVQLLLQDTIPLWYVDGSRYKVAWSDVDQVFMLINETNQHWCLAQFDIRTGVVTFYDNGITYDPEWREWLKLPEVLMQGEFFDQKGIDHTTYNITFANAVNVPRQAEVFGDCGIWVSIFLYRLAHGLSLDVVNPNSRHALSISEKRMAQFYFKNFISIW
ncbi:phospholipase-like protein [Tanacetum coccineum]